jgi:hypothetical protein
MLFHDFKFTEEDIITDRKDIPRITYTLNDKNKYYFPDIYVKSQNKFIEVKSDWTFEKHEEQCMLKANASINAGFQYEFWIFTTRGKTLTIHTV